MGDLFGERGCVGAVVEPDFLLDSDAGSVGKPDAHAADFSAGLTQKSDHCIAAGPQACSANDYDPVGHPNRSLNRT
jgi:hypothetical protein